MGNTKVLIVDDEEDVVRTFQFRLEAAGYETFTASNGAEAIRILRQNEVDLVLADFMMPELDGLELARHVQENPGLVATKVVLFSCVADAGFRERALALGALDWLQKADGGNSIVNRVYEILEPRSALRKAGPEAACEGPPERCVSRQLQAISLTMVDLGRLARTPESLPRQVPLASGCSRGLTQDLANLAVSLEPKQRARVER